jgi:hypothetical protein
MSDPVTYTGVLSIRPATVRFLSGLLAGERARRGTREGRRALDCHDQAVLALRWFTDGVRVAQLAVDNAIGTSTVYRYLHEAIDVLAARAPGLHGALLAARAAGSFRPNGGGNAARRRYQSRPAECRAARDGKGRGSQVLPPQSRRLETAPDCPVLVRYADDAVAMCHSREQAEQVKTRLAEWLAPRGLVFNEDKTRIVHLDETGFDFLGFNVRRYHGKLVLIKPSREAVRRIRRRLRTELRALRGSNAAGVLKKLTPIIRGWAAYYRTEVSSEVFSALDDYMWKLTYRWARHRHPKKSRWWVVDRYYGQFNPTKRNRWVFGDRDTGAYLPKFAWTKIVRHAMVIGTASPDDPALAQYWAQRRRKQAPPPLSAPVRHLLGAQQGRCVACGGLLLHADQHPQSPQEWEQWVRVTLVAIRKQHIATRRDGTDGLRLIHAFCRRRTTVRGPEGPVDLHA